MKFQINASSPVRAIVSSLRISAAVYRVAANVGDLVARGVEAVTSDSAIQALAAHLAEATAPLEAVVPEVGDHAARTAKIEVGLRRDIHGDVPSEAAAAACPGRSRSARRRAKARARKAAEAQAQAQANRFFA